MNTAGNRDVSFTMERPGMRAGLDRYAWSDALDSTRINKDAALLLYQSLRRCA